MSEVNANDVIAVYQEQLARAQHELALNAARAAGLSRDLDAANARVKAMEDAVPAPQTPP